jgi:hypothetical protein
MRKPFTPCEYQTLAIQHIVNTPRCALWAGMGMGKTVSTLTALQQLKSAGERRVTLLLAPRVARTTWPEEALKWEHLEGLGQGIRAINSATLSGKLLQATAGAVYTHTGSAEFKEIHSAKLEALDSVIEELGGEPLIVVYKWKSDLARLKARYPKARELRTPQDEVDWNEGKIDLLLLHPASAGHGVNLQHGGRNMAWFSVDFDLELYQQVRERIGPVRQLQSGYDRVVREYYLLARDSVDELAMERLSGKAMTQDELMRYAKRRGAGVARAPAKGLRASPAASMTLSESRWAKSQTGLASQPARSFPASAPEYAPSLLAANPWSAGRP